MFVTPVYAQETPVATGEAHTEVAADGHGSGGFPPFDPTFFASQLLWLAITFGLFYLFMKRVVMPRIGGILEVRSDRIAQDLEQAARMKEDADAAIAAYEQELADARKKAGQIGNEARDSAKADAEAERKRIEAGLESKLGEAEARIAAIKQTAMQDVGTIAEETTIAIVRELVGGTVDKATVAAAVRDVRS